MLYIKVLQNSHENTSTMVSFIIKLQDGTPFLQNTSAFDLITVQLLFDLATSISGVFGAWSNEGCNVSDIQKYDGYVNCTCNHLTNFALLLDVSQTRAKPLALSIVTWIGCVISILGLVLTIITYSCFKQVYLNLWFK